MILGQFNNLLVRRNLGEFGLVLVWFCFNIVLQTENQITQDYYICVY